MDINEINIKGCVDCPFRYTDWNEYSIGDDILEKCILGQNLRLTDYFIDSYDSKKEEELKLKTPKWCPIKGKKLIITFI